MSNALNILLVEDQEDDAFLIKQAFTKAGARSNLHVVENGLEAVQYLKGEGLFADRSSHPFPQVMLLDLNMPQMNGFEVLQWIRKDPQYAGLIVHIFSASSREADVQQAYELGANSYVVKPSRMDELTAFAEALHHWHGFTQFCDK